MDEDGKTIHRLLSGKDSNKDQSYFLCQLNQDQLSKALFPIGGMLKSEVREVAAAHGLVTADKKDSQGLCFIGKVRLPEFLQQKLDPLKGAVVEIPFDFDGYNMVRETLSEQALPYTYAPADGKVIGEHNGAHYFTIGQRKGLGIGGSKSPLFVIGTDVKTNTIYVGQGEDHPGLWRKSLYILASDSHWIREDLKLEVGTSKPFEVRIRYRQKLHSAELFQDKEGIYIVFENPMKSITPGQFAAWYKNQELIGSGVIHK